MDITVINWTLISATAGLAVGWWLRGQTFATVESDIASIKTDIINIKNYFSPQAVVVTPVAPVTPAPVVVHEAGVVAA